MRLRKEVKLIDEGVLNAFSTVATDMAAVVQELNYTKKRINKLEKVVSILLKDQKRFTKVGPLTGRTYTTLNGRVHAIAQHLGLEFVAKPKEIVKAKVDVVKATKKGKK